MKIEYINCSWCGKTIKKNGQRVLCIACSNKRDKEIARIYRDTHQEEIKAKNRERARLKREAVKLDE